MKKITSLFWIAFLVLSFQDTNAQDKNNPWKITIGTNAVDFFPTGGHLPGSGENLEQFFNTSHWNIFSGVSTLSLQKYVGNNVSFGLSGSYNTIDTFGELTTDDLDYYSFDFGVTYNLVDALFGERSKFASKFDGFLGLGFGYTNMEQGEYNNDPENNSSVTSNFTVGFNYWFTERVGFTYQSAFKYTDVKTVNVPQHYQHTAGIAIKFGGTDSDGDTIYDKFDACPDVAGLPEFNGCPDTDGDGIIDSKDACPSIAGLPAYNGCPDTDGDGVSDNNDKCPTEAGLASLGGCPDTDNDGIANGADSCPTQAGPAANGGCPWPDTDGDGVLDKDDNCPNEAGVVANAGCPEVINPTAAELKQISDYAKEVTFKLGKISLKEEAKVALQAIAAIMSEYPKANFSVEGHTDSIGTNSDFNQLLSERRAEVVVDFLVENGVAKSRLSFTGFGEDKPVGDNLTAAGRLSNRRVEINLAE